MKSRYLQVSVLIALMVIFIPLFWVTPSSQEEEVENLSVMPVAPRKPALLNAVRARSTPLSEQHPKLVTRYQAASVAEDEDVQRVKMFATGWVVQVAELTDSVVAQQQVMWLRSRGFIAYQQTSAKGAIRVFVGPVVTRMEADALQEQLRTILQLDGTVMSFRLNTTGEE